MKFYDRETEIKTLLGIRKRSFKSAEMTFITGRRRIGKTQLLLKATEGQPTLYFFVARKSEPFLCQDFISEIEQKLNVPILGNIDRFAKIFEFLMVLSKKQRFNLIIDEFQEFFNINPSVFSEMQKYWDLHKDQSKMNLLISGSVNSLMHKIFENSKEPLFGRATAHMNIKPFQTFVLKEILSDFNPKFKPDDLLALYLFTGGVAKYVQLLMDSGANNKAKIQQQILQADSVFITEGKNILIEEFGKEYITYFAILTCIARGENSRTKIEAILNREIGGYLTKLENDYGIITKIKPILAKVETKHIRYEIKDNFLMFWFRFIYKFGYLVESGNLGALNEIVTRDYTTFSGKILERYFIETLKEQKKHTQIGSFWDKKGQNEIDIIAINELKKQILFIEVKRNPKQIKLDVLKDKANHFLSLHPNLKHYKKEYKGLSLEDV